MLISKQRNEVSNIALQWSAGRREACVGPVIGGYKVSNYYFFLRMEAHMHDVVVCVGLTVSCM